MASQAGRWTDAQTYVVDAVVADAGVDADAVTIDITGAHDVAGNLQVDHTATVGLEVDTENPTHRPFRLKLLTMIRRMVMRRRRSLFRRTDLDPGMIHVDMRGSEYTELTSIKSSYISEVETAIAGLEAAESHCSGS